MNSTPILIGKVFLAMAVVVAITHGLDLHVLQIGGIDVSLFLPIAAAIIYGVVPALEESQSETDYNCYATANKDTDSKEEDSQTADDDEDTIPITGNCPSMMYQQPQATGEQVAVAMATPVVQQTPTATPAFAVATNADLTQQTADPWSSEVVTPPSKGHDFPEGDDMVWGEAAPDVLLKPQVEPDVQPTAAPQSSYSGDNSTWDDNGVVWEPPSKEYPTIDE
jgi:hypothetical protein